MDNDGNFFSNFSNLYLIKIAIWLYKIDTKWWYDFLGHMPGYSMMGYYLGQNNYLQDPEHFGLKLCHNNKLKMTTVSMKEKLYYFYCFRIFYLIRFFLR